jgi:poly(3-hydroxybutyrate) depolymerase
MTNTITNTGTDPTEWRFGFGEPFIDVDEWRDEPRRHRYVHGGFAGTETRFSFYLPPNEQYDGRLVQYLEGGMGGHENTLAAGMLTGTWLFDLAFDELGAYLVESNQGHFPGPGHGFNDDIENWGASAEAARFSWQVAEEMYGAAPHHGYVWGVSGGGGRTMSCIENGADVWDGAAPHMCYSGSNHASWSAEGYWWLHARHKLADVVDAMAPGGSGDPLATLTTAERDGLVAVLRHGFPRAALSQLWQFAPWVWFLLVQAEMMPYFQDFWNKPGHLGHDEPERIAPLVFDFTATVERVLSLSDMPATTLAGRLASAGAVSDLVSAITINPGLDDPTRYFGARIEILTGDAAGRVVPCTQSEEGLLATSIESHAELFAGVKPGDEVRIDNRDFVAWCHLFLHQLDLADDGHLDAEWGGLTAWMIDGKPMYPQIPTNLIGAGGGPQGHSGRFEGKVVHVNTSADSMVWPNGAVGWTHKIVAQQGESRHERYRMWWIENSPHAEPGMLLPAVTAQKDGAKWRAELVSYNGATAQALRDLVSWVEDGVTPAPGTEFAFTDDGGLVLPDTAEERGGVQPLVWLTANGGERADVAVGSTVQLRGVAQQPPGRGSVVWSEWDFEGAGHNSERTPAAADDERLVIEQEHTFDSPGTYFVTFRVGGHRDGLAGRGLAVENLARARVVVT